MADHAQASAPRPSRPSRRPLFGAVLVALVFLVACTSGPGPTTTPSTAAVSTTAPVTSAVPVGDRTIVVVGTRGSGPDEGVMAEVLTRWSDLTGVPVAYQPVDDVAREFRRRVDRDERGDVYLLGSGEVILAAATDRTIRAVPRTVDSAIGEAWSSAWTRPARLGDVLYGVPIASAVESLIWYRPAVFESFGFDVPDSWIELVALVEEAIDDDIAPFCGFPDADARATAFVGWVFDLTLRSFEPSVYDDYLSAGRPVDDRESVDLWVNLREVLTGDGAGFDVIDADADGIDSDEDVDSPPRLGPEALLAGECLMIRGGLDVVWSFPDGTAFADGTAGAVDAMITPGPRGNVPVVADVTYAVSRDDRAEVWSLLQYLGGAQHATDRRGLQASGAGERPAFTSAAVGQDMFQLSLLELSLLDLSSRATEHREAWTELLPTAVQFAFVDAAESVLDDGQRITPALERVETFRSGS